MMTKLVRFTTIAASIGVIDCYSRVNPGRIAILSRLSTFSEPLGRNIADFRKEYSKKPLLEGDIKSNPIDQFQLWFDEACESKLLEPNAMCLSTCKDNKPSARIVLMKSFDDSGFVWYTNYHSRKGFELESNPFAALTFWWGDLERSVRIEGVVERVPESQSDQYFQSRPRGSRIGAWTSNQSQFVSDRESLEAQELDIIRKFSGKDIPRPEHWGGYRLRPSRIEFWKGRESRLHDRIVFSKNENNSWDIERLQP